MIKKIFYIFIPVLAVLLMSHNTFALTISQNVDIIQTVNQPKVSFYNGSSWSNYQSGYLSFSGDAGNFIEMRLTKNDFTSIDAFNKNDYIIINGFFVANKLFYQEMGESFFNAGLIGSDGRAVNCSIIDLQFGAVQEYAQNSQFLYRSDFVMTCKITNANVVDNNLTINFRLRSNLLSSGRGQLDISFNGATLATPSNDVQREKEATQEASNNSQNAGNTSTTNSQNATSSLLSVIASGVGAITSASPTNCKINGNMGNLNIGNIDLCANPVPTFMALIGSIIAVLVVLPLVILLFNRFISIIRSFQR